MDERDTLLAAVGRKIDRLSQALLREQKPDGTWRFCFEGSLVTDAYMIILMRMLKLSDEEALVSRLAERLADMQQANGAWRLYEDEAAGGNLSATVLAYYALLYAGRYRKEDPPMRLARDFIMAQGGLGETDILTKVPLSVGGQYPWRNHFAVPVEVLLLPELSPIKFQDFSAYARVYMAPFFILSNKRFTLRTPDAPDLSGLADRRAFHGHHGPTPPFRAHSLFGKLEEGIKALWHVPEKLHDEALAKAERYMLERVEPNGLLYSYVTATVWMIWALLALGRKQDDPLIVKAIGGMKTMACGNGHIQNSTSTVWDTALAGHALLAAGTDPKREPIRRTAAYLLARQQQRYGDWSWRNPRVLPGGWGFSDVNTIQPDVDDSTAALRVIHRLRGSAPEYDAAWSRGLNWVLSMQNDDGGWAAFERNSDKQLLTWLPVPGGEWAAIDPSTADLTGRTLELLGSAAGLRMSHPIVSRGVNWLLNRQRDDGSWFGRWGVAFLYGTWAALTGLSAVGVPPEHPAVRKAAQWLQERQLPDGGWGESCRSDAAGRYVPLGFSTPSQTAWAIDALVSALPAPTPELERGVRRLVEGGWSAAQARYPTGAALPGSFYVDYHSYSSVWPLLALSRYRAKFG